MGLEVQIGGGGRRVSQEFKSLCGKFGVGKEEGAEEVARMRLGNDLNCSFASVASNSPGPIKRRGAQRKLIFKQMKISFPVIERVRGSGLVRPSTNRKRVEKRTAGGSVKKLKVWR